MNPAELRARSIRRRRRIEIEADITNACQYLGALAAASKLSRAPMDHGVVRSQIRGLQELLAERSEDERAQEVQSND
ncbi:MAG TPA: hypothetical protein VFL78_11695 [Rhodanobacteraceae bacterium]|nr:hypothetical protein [Rhodanobacteraceae bacterium]